MRYARIIAAVAGSAWAIHPLKAEAMLQFLVFAAAGGKRTPADVARIVGFDQEDERIERENRKRAEEEQRRVAERGSVAVLGLKGVISPRLSDEMNISGPGGTSAEGFSRRFREAVDDSNVSAIVSDVDSPGGSVFGVPELAQQIRDARGSKPLVAVVNPFCASAAYWIASAFDEIVVMSSAEVGSIGVYAYHEALPKMLETAGVTPTLIKAGPHKAETHPAFLLSDEAKAHMQARVDAYYQQFLDAVAQGRGVKVPDVVEHFGGGRMLGAEDAVKVGMADRIGTLEEEIARLKASPVPQSKRRSKAMAERRLALM